MSSASDIAAVSKIMKVDVVTVSPTDNVLMAANKMNQSRIGSVIIEESGKPVGILTEKDILQIVRDQRNPEEVDVKDAMTTPILMVEETTTIEQAASLMSEKKVRRLPIVRNEKLVGIISQTDIVHAVGKGVLTREVKIYMSDIFREHNSP